MKVIIYIEGEDGSYGPMEMEKVWEMWDRGRLRKTDLFRYAENPWDQSEKRSLRELITPEFIQKYRKR